MDSPQATEELGGINLPRQQEILISSQTPSFIQPQAYDEDRLGESFDGNFMGSRSKAGKNIARWRIAGRIANPEVMYS